MFIVLRRYARNEICVKPFFRISTGLAVLTEKMRDDKIDTRERSFFQSEMRMAEGCCGLYNTGGE